MVWIELYLNLAYTNTISCEHIDIIGRGMRLASTTRSMSVFFILALITILFMYARTPDKRTTAHGTPNIAVDGQFSDWQDIEPIINDTGDVSSLYSYYDLTECYLLTDPNWFYFLFMKTPCGSAGWIIYFDTDLSNQSGYQINEMGADYRYNRGSEDGFYHWTDNDWYSLDSSDTESRGGFVGSGSNSTEWLEGKIATSALGNPTSFRVVFYIKGGEDIAPKTGYITVVNSDNLAFAVSFTSDRHVLSHDGTSHLTFKIQNYGPTGISEADIKIPIPPHLAVISGGNTWNGTINSGQGIEVKITVQTLTYGSSTSRADFSWNSGSPQSFKTPLTIITAPRIALQVQPVTNFRLGIAGAFNVTVINFDPYVVEATVETLSYSDIDGFSMNMMLGPNSIVQSFYNVTFTEVGNFHLYLHAVFEGLELTRASTFVSISKPNIWISFANITTDMRLGAEYPLTVTIQNDEDYAYSVNVLATVEYQQPSETQELFVDLPARSNRTVTLEIKPREQGTYALNVSLIMYEIVLGTKFLYDINIQPNFSLLLTYGLIITVVAAALIYLITRSRQKRNAIARARPISREQASSARKDSYLPFTFRTNEK